jgi:hypothetical protein
LHDDAREWQHFVQNIGAIVFLAHSFGDLILPGDIGEECSRTRVMEKGRDYLATPIYMLKGDERQRLRNNDHSKGSLQVNDTFFWNGFDPRMELTPCMCTHGKQHECKTLSRLERKERVNKADTSHGPLDVFQAFPNSAAIIGGPNVLKSARPTTTQEARTHITETGWKKWKTRLDKFLNRKI